MEEPQIIISAADAQPHEVQFEDVYKLRDGIVWIKLIFNDNSYYLNVRERYFKINDGRKKYYYDDAIKFASLLCIKRHHVELKPDTGDKCESIAYLLGLYGCHLSGSPMEMLLRISDDGTQYYWKNHR